MTIIPSLATSLNRRDEVANQELARRIIEKHHREAVKELVDNLSNTNRSIQSDCIKVLYEIGEQEPSFIAPYCKEFGSLLESRNNRLVWGAMTALDCIAALKSRSVYALLGRIIEVANGDSVIARDHAVGILIKLSADRQFSARCIPLLLEQLRKCPDNQFPMYVERATDLLASRFGDEFVAILEARIGLLERESQKKRVAKVLRKVIRSASK